MYRLTDAQNDRVGFHGRLLDLRLRIAESVTLQNSDGDDTITVTTTIGKLVLEDRIIGQMLLRMIIDIVADGPAHHHVLPVLADVVAHTDDHAELLSVLEPYLRFMYPRWDTSFPEMTAVLRCIARGWDNWFVRDHLYRWCTESPWDLHDCGLAVRAYLACFGMQIPTYRSGLIPIIIEACWTLFPRHSDVVQEIVDVFDRFLADSPPDDETIGQIYAGIQTMLAQARPIGTSSLPVPLIGLLRYGCHGDHHWPGITTVIQTLLHDPTPDGIAAAILALGGDIAQDRPFAAIGDRIRKILWDRSSLSPAARGDVIRAVCRMVPPDRLRSVIPDMIDYLRRGAMEQPDGETTSRVFHRDEPVIVAALEAVAAIGASHIPPNLRDSLIPLLCTYIEAPLPSITHAAWHAVVAIPPTTEQHRQTLYEVIDRQAPTIDHPSIHRILVELLARLIGTPTYHRSYLHQSMDAMQHLIRREEDWLHVAAILRQVLTDHPDALPDVASSFRLLTNALPQVAYYRIGLTIFQDRLMHPVVHAVVVHPMMAWLQTMEPSVHRARDFHLREIGIPDSIGRLLTNPSIGERDVAVLRPWIREACRHGWEDVADAIGVAMIHQVVADEVRSVLHWACGQKHDVDANDRQTIVRMVLRAFRRWMHYPEPSRSPVIHHMLMDAMVKVLHTRLPRISDDSASDSTMITDLIDGVRMGMPYVRDPIPIISAVLPYASHPNAHVRIAVGEFIGDAMMILPLPLPNDLIDTMLQLTEDVSPNVVRAVMCAVCRGWLNPHPSPHLLTLTVRLGRLLVTG